MIAFVLAVALVVVQWTTTVALVSAPFESELPQIQQMQDAINVYRETNGLRTLPLALHLMYAVEVRAHELRDTCTFAHDDLGDRVWRQGYPRVTVGEVLAANAPVPADALEVWLSSPAHKAILDDPRWRGMGIAVVSYKQPCQHVDVWVIDFGESDEADL